MTSERKTIKSLPKPVFLNRLKKNCFRFTLSESELQDIFRQTSVTDASKGAGGSASVWVRSNSETGSLIKLPVSG